ncbi:MAG: nucleotidyltransferase family protein [Candidatus Magasanikbacteria bacterium]|jgi:NDP-sugar pyrophosphorylase family protein|nr:nucleotidyltransferase family protein [Candidatus Magasanikbacteria bacterium]MBT4314582.1 nucleotidyltransferase family protein [Candidatus Magasanikbacteria bacterium]MBT4546785.1 nucleotidyltransferase family protein [Candidatus Magasanikbacteria bacterium]MBT6818794.1 nucleotidyltransferase family protein [Candidatus Magasanikbacteria bacterium]
MSRIRLTITLEQKILKYIDSIVDKKKIRNRSHAIEYVLDKYFSPKISKALILAAGESCNEKTCKVMQKINGKPVLHNIIKKLADFGINEATIVVGGGSEEIKKYFGDGEKFGLAIRYEKQKKPGSGTARAIFAAKQSFYNQPFILWYGDVWADLDLDDLVHTHLKEKKLATMALTSVSEPGGWGVVQLRGLSVVQLKEKPGKNGHDSYLINAGVYVLDPKLLDSIKKDSVSFEREVLSKMAKDNKLCGYVFADKWQDIGLE